MKDGTIDMDFANLAVEYWVRTVPGSLVELEDEKQLRILNQLFVPLSQAMPALAATDNKDMLQQAAKAMQYIISKQIELSGSASAKDIGLVFNGDVEEVDERDRKIAALEEGMHVVEAGVDGLVSLNTAAIQQMQEQIELLAQNQGLILQKLGAPPPSYPAAEGASAPPSGHMMQPRHNVAPVSA
jgi:hypothetical protein